MNMPVHPFDVKDLVLTQVLHAGSTNKNAYKALIAAEYSGVKVELVKDFEMGVSNKTPEFFKMNPIGKVDFLSQKILFLFSIFFSFYQ